jgi:hypothetical protein
MEALQRVKLNGFQMVIAELEVEQDYLRRAMPLLGRVKVKLTWLRSLVTACLFRRSSRANSALIRHGQPVGSRSQQPQSILGFVEFQVCVTKFVCLGRFTC